MKFRNVQSTIIGISAVALLALAGPAFAANNQSTIDINLAAAGVNQIVTDKVNQTAVSVDATFGPVKGGSIVDSTAANVVNDVSVDQTVSGLVPPVYGGEGALAGITQRVTAPVTQQAFSATLNGPVTGASNVASVAANVVNAADVVQKVK